MVDHVINLQFLFDNGPSGLISDIEQKELEYKYCTY